MTQAADAFEQLLGRMKQIADVVNGFASESVQQQAFSALYQAATSGVRSLEGVGDRDSSVKAPSGGTPPGAAREAAAIEQPSRQRRRSNASSSDWTFDKSLDLRPAGKLSFSDFVEQKQPRSNEDRFAAVIYYLTEVLEFPAVTADHVGSVFRLTPSWREPSGLPTRLRVTSSRKGTFSTSNMKDIKLTPHGRNFVEHDLPPKKAAKS